MNEEIITAVAAEAMRELAGIVTRSLPNLTMKQEVIFWREVARLASGRAAARDTRSTVEIAREASQQAARSLASVVNVQVMESEPPDLKRGLVVCVHCGNEVAKADTWKVNVAAGQRDAYLCSNCHPFPSVPRERTHGR